MPLMMPRAVGLRTVTPCSRPAGATSSTYSACPVTFARPSLRWTERPIWGASIERVILVLYAPSRATAAPSSTAHPHSLWRRASVRRNAAGRDWRKAARQLRRDAPEDHIAGAGHLTGKAVRHDRIGTPSPGGLASHGTDGRDAAVDPRRARRGGAAGLRPRR